MEVVDRNREMREKGSGLFEDGEFSVRAEIDGDGTVQVDGSGWTG